LTIIFIFVIKIFYDPAAITASVEILLQIHRGSTSSRRQPPMPVTIVQAAIESALRDYIAHQLGDGIHLKMEIKLAATRGDKGFTATITIPRTTKDPARRIP